MVPVCELCGGDCSAANPPVIDCPQRDDYDISHDLKRGDLIYMPALGDTPRDAMKFIEAYGDGYGRMAAMEYRNGTRTAFPMRFVRKLPPSEPIDDGQIFLMLLFASLAAFLIYGLMR